MWQDYLKIFLQVTGLMTRNNVDIQLDPDIEISYFFIFCNIVAHAVELTAVVRKATKGHPKIG